MNQQWIHVSERIPEMVAESPMASPLVLIWSVAEKRPLIGRYFFQWGRFIPAATHWMPLPEPPE